MNSLLHITRQILSGKKISVFIVLLVIAARVLQLLFFYNIRVDGMYQVMAMQNFAHGHGISLGTVLPGDLSTIVYEPLINWPPGYSVLLSPFYLLSGHNYIIAGLTVDILAAIALIFITRKILTTLNTPLYLINIFTLLTGFFIYYFYFIASSDAVAITFFLVAIHTALLMLKKGHSSIKLTFTLIFFLFLAGFIKYLFIPVIFIIPVYIFIKGIAEKNKIFRRTAVISFLFLAVIFSTLLLYQLYTSGSAAYISEPSRGYFPENLQAMWPSWPASFIKPETIGLVSPGSEFISLRILQWLHIILFITAAIFFFRSIAKGQLRSASSTNNYFYITFLLSAGITLLLAALSLRVAKEENIPGNWWTYIEEPRYYGLINVLLHMGVFVFYQCYLRKKSVALKYIITGLIILLLPETFRGLIFTTRRVMNMNKEEYSWQYEHSIQKYADAIIKKERAKDPMGLIVVTGSFYYHYNRVSIYSHVPPLSAPASINDLGTLNTKKPATLLVILHENDLKYFQPFMNNKDKQPAGRFRGFNFYTVHVNPH